MTWREPKKVVKSEFHDMLNRRKVRKLVRKFLRDKVTTVPQSKFQVTILPGTRIIVEKK